MVVESKAGWFLRDFSIEKVDSDIFGLQLVWLHVLYHVNVLYFKEHQFVKTTFPPYLLKVINCISFGKVEKKSRDLVLRLEYYKNIFCDCI